MDKHTLLHAIKESIGSDQSDGEVNSLLEKLLFLENTGRYGELLGTISSTNDKSNLLATIFEAIFAYQYESADLSLEYEAKQDEADTSSIDFLRRMESGTKVFFEARLLQQDAATVVSIEDQLRDTTIYKVAMNGQDEHDSIVRLQTVILSKVQKTDGTPTKFLRTSPDCVNIVVINVTDLFLGMVDLQDCLLATHGDPYVDEACRRGIFGLFQEPLTGYPPEIQKIAKSYDHIRRTLSGVLFLFKSSDSGMLNYGLENYMVFNPLLISKSIADEVIKEISDVIPVRHD